MKTKWKNVRSKSTSTFKMLVWLMHSIHWWWPKISKTWICGDLKRNMVEWLLTKSFQLQHYKCFGSLHNSFKSFFRKSCNIYSEIFSYNIVLTQLPCVLILHLILGIEKKSIPGQICSWNSIGSACFALKNLYTIIRLCRNQNDQKKIELNIFHSTEFKNAQTRSSGNKEWFLCTLHWPNLFGLS